MIMASRGWLSVLGLIAFLSVGFCCKENTPLPHFTVNLDLPPEERWVEIGKKYARFAPEMRRILHSWIPANLRDLVLKLAEQMLQFLPPSYSGEVRGLSKVLNLTVGEIVLCNVQYDFNVGCTGIVAQDQRGNIFHGRNLDYAFSDFLRLVSVDVDFIKDGKIKYSATTFVGFVGLFTGEKPGVFTVSVDARHSGSLWMNFLMCLSGKGNIVSLFVRDLLETAESFDAAIKRAKREMFIAPNYLIMGGVNPGEGVVVTNDRLATADVWFLNQTQDRWYIVETNYDHWKNAPKSDDRRDAAIKALTDIGSTHISPETLYKVLSTTLVLNRSTIYSTIMSARFPKLYHSRCRNSKQVN